MATVGFYNNLNHRHHNDSNDNNNYDLEEIFLESTIAICIFAGFCGLAMLWQYLYVFFTRRLFKIQRWKSLERLYYLLDVSDHILHNQINPKTLPKKILVKKRNKITKYPKDSFESEKSNFFDPNSIHEICHMRPKLKTYHVMQTSEYERKYQNTKLQKEYVNNLWAQEKKNRIKTWIKKYLCCAPSKKKKIRNRETIGYSFGNHYWFPKDVEHRPWHKYLRGNFITFVGSLGVAGIIGIGLRVALIKAGQQLTYLLTGGVLLAAITIFRFSDYVSPIMSYFSILWSDMIERGNIVEISPNYSGLGVGSAGSLVGCVLEINLGHVKMLVIKPYKDADSSDFPSYISDEFGTVIKREELFGLENPKKIKGHKILQQRSFRTRLVVNVPVSCFATHMVGIHSSWYPVLTFEEIVL